MHAETTPDKLDAWQEVRFHRIFKGDDWRGTAKGARARGGRAVGVEVVYFPYTMHTSSTQLRRALADGPRPTRAVLAAPVTAPRPPRTRSPTTG